MLSALRSAASRRDSRDRAHAIEHGDAIVVVVADGAGGIVGGSIASDAAIAAVRERVGADGFDPYDVSAWCDAFATVDADLARRTDAGETTAIVIVASPRGIVGGSVGDCEAWVVAPSRVESLTEHQHRARLGSGVCQPTSFDRPALDGVLIVATDGLFKHASYEAIVAACTSLDVTTIADALIVLPKLRSGAYPDDVAVVVASH
jgi:serine/threonine protein phosphatase PrpC